MAFIVIEWKRSKFIHRNLDVVTILNNKAYENRLINVRSAAGG